MEYRKLGTTGLKVSELSLGCMTFGRESSEEESRKMIDKFIEVGGNFLDTANVYAAGLLALQDAPRSDSKSVIDGIRKLGVREKTELG
jgi:aryl-alcohol dehydrogenase-like predicted oxidoreductase